MALRKEKGLSQIQLAEMMNVSRQAVSRWEVGASVPSTDNLKYLGELYDVSLEYLLHDDATESIRVDKEKESDEEKTISTNGTKRTIRSIVLVLIVVAPDGLSYGLNTTTGSFDDAIKVSQRGHYYLAVRNNSSKPVHVYGHVNY